MSSASRRLPRRRPTSAARRKPPNPDRLVSGPPVSRTDRVWIPRQEVARTPVRVVGVRHLASRRAGVVGVLIRAVLVLVVAVAAAVSLLAALLRVSLLRRALLAVLATTARAATAATSAATAIAAAVVAAATAAPRTTPPIFQTTAAARRSQRRGRQQSEQHPFHVFDSFQAKVLGRIVAVSSSRSAKFNKSA